MSKIDVSAENPSTSFAGQQQRIRALIDVSMYSHRHQLRQNLKRLLATAPDASDFDDKVEQFFNRLQQSLERVERRQNTVPKCIEFPESLPVSERREEILALIKQHQLIVIAGETGSGKTTQIPKLCLQAGRGIYGQIAHTQPRRIAARTVADRIAQELKMPLGDGVGYQIRFQDQSQDNTLIKLMTDGILLAEIQQDPYLNRYDTIIIDEAHERSLNIDFLLGYLKTLLRKRPELKVIITSATIDVERFSAHFDQAPIVEVSGRTFPVDVLYRSPLETDADDEKQAIHAAIDELISIEKQRDDLSAGGDILIFLNGERDIRETALYLRRQELRHCDILPLYARLSQAEQNRVFDLSQRRGRRIVLATNVAETSLTVPGIRYVIDTGTARISRYSYRTKVQRLPIERISQSSANQRAGRCGRVANGVCIRLYDEQDYLSRDAFTDPEIMRTNLAAVILQMANLNLGHIRDFAFIDPPDHRMVNDGYKLLQEVNALDDRNRLAPLGKQLAKLPLDPRLGRMLIASSDLSCLREALIITSFLSVQDPRERPADKKAAADEKHRRFADVHSEFSAMVNLWHYIENQRQELSNSQFRKLCKKEFLSWTRLREWRDIHHQLKLAAQTLGFKDNAEAADYVSLHRAILTGLLSHIGTRDGKQDYIGARNRKFWIFPGSTLKAKNIKWLMAAELIETTKLYANHVAKIEPEWLIGIADHLFKRSYSEPHWGQRRGQVMAYQKTSLFGLQIEERQRVNYGSINPEESREIFIREGLVARQCNSKAEFYRHNSRLIDEVLALEAKSRRRDILADEQRIYEFYDGQIPNTINSLRSAERWVEKQAKQNPNTLKLSREFLLQGSEAGLGEQQFPESLSYKDAKFALTYRFEPGAIDDGVSLMVPLALLNRVPEHLLDWLVPGILHEKCVALVKSLPKQLRKQFVPVPDVVSKALANMTVSNEPLTRLLTEELNRVATLKVKDDDWQHVKLDDYYRMNLKILDAKGKLLGQGRDFKALLERFRGDLQAQLAESEQSKQTPQPVNTWSFDAVPAVHKFKQAGVEITAYPGIKDLGEQGVQVELFDFAEQAALEHQQGLLRLALLSLKQSHKYLRKELFKANDIKLKLAVVATPEKMAQDLIAASAKACFYPQLDQLPRSHQAFEDNLEQRRSHWVGIAQDFETQVERIFKAFYPLQRQLNKSLNPELLNCYQDVKLQLSRLVYPGFILDFDLDELQAIERYIQAAQYRIDNIGGRLKQDRLAIDELEVLGEPLWQLQQSDPAVFRRLPEVRKYRWMLEEYRVSLFAQRIGASIPISAKRLRQQWQIIKQELV